MNTIQKYRSHLKITRVSKAAIDFYEGLIRARIKSDVMAHQTKGSTFSTENIIYSDNNHANM